MIGLGLMLGEERVTLDEVGPQLGPLLPRGRSGRRFETVGAKLHNHSWVGHQVPVPLRHIRGSRVGGNHQQSITMVLEHDRDCVWAAGPRPGRGEQERAASAERRSQHPLVGPELRDHLAVETSDVVGDGRGCLSS